MPSWALTIDIDAPPDEVWAFIGDPTTVPRWYPKYVSCEVDGDTRTLRSAEGAVLHEALLERDDGARASTPTACSPGRRCARTGRASR